MNCLEKVNSLDYNLTLYTPMNNDAVLSKARVHWCGNSVTVAETSRELPMLVEGASWSLFRIDDTHSRLLLIDPGYVSPSKIKARIMLQNARPITAPDILTGEEIETGKDIITIEVPAGSMRFIDFEYLNR